MRLYLLISLFELGICPFTYLQAKEPNLDGFSFRWIATPFHKTATKQGDIEIKVLKRFVVTRARAYPIGSVFLFKGPRALFPEDSIESISKNLETALGVQWTRSKKGHSRIYESYWDIANRNIRYYFTENRNRILFSVATYRTSYSETIGFEASAIQEKFGEDLGKKDGWQDRLVSFLESDIFVPTSYAGGNDTAGLPLSTILGAAAGGSGGTQGSGASDPFGFGQVTTSMNGMTTEIHGLNGNLGQLNTHAGGMETKVGDLSDNLGDVSDNLGGVTGELGSLNRNIESVAALFTPAHMIAVGVGAGLGFGLGGLAVSAAVSGLKMLAGVIFEAITQKKEKAQLTERFQKAIKDYKEVKPKVDQLEGKLDAALASLNGYSEMAVESLKINPTPAETAQQADGSNGSSNCHHQAADQNVIQLRPQENLCKSLTKEICRGWKENVSSLLQIEEDLQIVRSRLSDPRAETYWTESYDKNYRETCKAYLDPKKRWKQEKSLYETELEQAKKNLDIQLKMDPVSTQALESLVKECQKNYSGNRLKRFVLSKRDCKKHLLALKLDFKDAHPLKDIVTAYKIRKDKAEARFNSCKNVNDPSIPNLATHESAIQSYKDFFQELFEDQRLSKTSEHNKKLEAMKNKIISLCMYVDQKRLDESKVGP